MSRPVLTEPDRFWSHVKREADGCWEWTGYRNPYGYGRVSIGQRQMGLAHRVAYTLTYGPIESGVLVLHHCDNPPCVNPAHLFLGTHKDNSDDKIAKGRERWIGPRGEQQSTHKLTAEDVRAIRQLHLLGVSHSALGQHFDVDESAIRKIVRRQSWAWLDA